MKILWSPLSVERLEDIFEYISKDNSPAARKMVNRIFKKVPIFKNQRYELLYMLVL